MSDSPAPPSEPAAAPDEAPGEAPGEAPALSSYRGVALALAGALILLLALVATAPFWAPALPWGPQPPDHAAALAARIDRLAAAQRQTQDTARQLQAATEAALQRLDQRIAARAAQPATPPAELAAIRQQLDKLSAAQTTAIGDLARRAAAANAVAAQTKAIGDLGKRVAAIGNEVRSRAASENADTALALTVLQIRDAVAAGRPFAAEYQRLAALALLHPEIADAAAPLAGAATTGVASRAALAERLHALAAQLAAAPQAPAAADGWADAALRRLGGLVTVHRLGEGAPGRPQSATERARQALAGGDLKGAIDDVAKLTGAAAEAARPWLRAAKERLAVEAALGRLQGLAGHERKPRAAPAAGSGSPG